MSDSTPSTRVVCAALRHKPTGLLICGARHYDSIMRVCIAALDLDPSNQFWDQGFIDQQGRFLTRAQAYEYALANGQILYDCSPGSRLLYSENLY